MFPAAFTSAARTFAGAGLALVLLGPWAWPVAAQTPAWPEAEELSAEETAALAAASPGRFIVVPYPIVDPALGNGLLVGPVWMRSGPPPAAGPAKPQAYGLGALWTDGGTRGIVAFDHRTWKQGAWRTTALAGDVELHFNYAGLRFDRDEDFGFVIAARGGSLSAERAVGTGPNTVSVSVFSARADVSPEVPPPVELAPDIGTAQLVGLTLGWARDTRDDVFLPSTGTALSAKLTVIPEALGASFDSQSVALKWTNYRPVGRGVIGLRAKADLGFGDPPFYLRPYLSFRGVAALRYAGEQATSLEAEYRRPVHGSWDALVFAAAGHVRSDFRGISEDKSVSAAGVGVRFRARKLFGLTFGLDLAQGPDGSVGYLQIGNAWTN